MFFDTPSVPTLIGSIVPFLVLDIVVVGLRFYTRRLLRQSLKLDDWLMIPCLIGTISLSSMYFFGISVKAFEYRWMFPPTGEPPVPVTADPSGRRIVITRKVRVLLQKLLHTVRLSQSQRTAVLSPDFRHMSALARS